MGLGVAGGRRTDRVVPCRAFRYGGCWMDSGSDRSNRLARAGVFVGRAAEVELLGGSLASAAAGRAQVILIEGPAGVGKTALVEQFVSDHSDRLLVLRASGDENETDVAWGVM